MKKNYNIFEIKKSKIINSIIGIFTICSFSLLKAQCVVSFYDDFETGTFIAPWVTAAGYTPLVNTTAPAEGLYSMNLSGSSGHYLGPKVLFTSATPNYITWRIKSSNTSLAGAYVVIGDASISTNNGIVFAYITGGNLNFISSTSYVYPVVAGTWYNVELKNVNYVTKTFDIWINGILMQTSFPFRSTTSTSINQLHVYNFNAGVVGSYDKIIIGSQSPTVTATPSSTTICAGTSITLNGGGASTYTWNGGVTNGSPFSPTITANYTVTGTATNGCTNTAVSSITVNPTPTISVTSGAICAGNSYTMVASGAVTYTYTGGSAVVTPTANTSYSVTGTSTLGCVGSNTAVSSVTVNANPSVSASTSNSMICSGESAILTASTSATSYTWNTGATTMSVSVSPTVTSTYTVNVSNAAACVSSSTVMVTVNACVGINEAVPSLISVYPNPNNGVVNINLTAELAKNASLEVYDALGKLVVKQVLANELNTINMSNLDNGIYTFKVLNNTNTVKIGKLIKH